MFLTPNLTPMQHARLQEVLSRMTGLLSAPLIYMDADRIAGAWMLAPWREHDTAAVTIEKLIATHPAPPVLVGYIAGLALGVRMGRTFAKPRRMPRQRPISDEFARLDADQRHDVTELIRRIARGDTVMTFESRRAEPAKTSTDMAGELAAARRWKQEAGRMTRGFR